MTLLTIASTVAKNVSIVPPEQVIGNNDPDAVILLQFINEAGQEIARRFDWSGLRKKALILGTGFDAPYDLPTDYARMGQGWGVTVDGNPVRGGLTADEWNALTPKEGMPRYFQTVGAKIQFYPFPAEGVQVTVPYISRHWTSANRATFAGDNESAVFPERLVELGATWRFLRRNKADFSDHLEEFEAAFLDLTRADEAVRLP
jgi:hypothetical protein